MENQLFDRYLFGNTPRPTKILLNLYVTLIIVSAIVSLVKGKQLKIGMLALGFILLVPMLYNTSCLVLGGCNIWAWLSIFSAVIIMVLNIINIIQTKEEPYESCDECF